MIVTLGHHPEAVGLYQRLLQELPTLTGGTQFKLGDTTLQIEGKDGLGGLIEEWFGVWATANNFGIYNPKTQDGTSQEFPDYYLGATKDGYLEIKTFDATASPNFDIANFESYCESVSNNPYRLFSDYLIFSYSLKGSVLKIEKVWLKKIWQITCASGAYPLKTQNKRDVIYNIRPSAFHSLTGKSQFPPFGSPGRFVDALYATQKQYNGITANRERFNATLQAKGIDLNNL